MLPIRSTRKLAAQLGISDTTVLKVWRANGLKPRLVETFKVSRDPKFVEKLEDICFQKQNIQGDILSVETPGWCGAYRSSRLLKFTDFRMSSGLY